MRNRAAIIGAGVSGLTCGVVFAERGWDATIFADETGQKTTSGAAAAVWFPYDAEPADKVIPWSLITYGRLRELACDSQSGASMLEIWQFTRVGLVPIPDWAKNLGARPISVIPSEVEGSLTIPAFPPFFPTATPSTSRSSTPRSTSITWPTGSTTPAAQLSRLILIRWRKFRAILM